MVGYGVLVNFYDNLVFLGLYNLGKIFVIGVLEDSNLLYGFCFVWGYLISLIYFLWLMLMRIYRFIEMSSLFFCF